MNIQLQKLVERKGLFVDIRLLVQIVGFSHLKYFLSFLYRYAFTNYREPFFFFFGNSNSYNNNLTTVH